MTCVNSDKSLEMNRVAAFTNFFTDNCVLNAILGIFYPLYDVFLFVGCKVVECEHDSIRLHARHVMY